MKAQRPSKTAQYMALFRAVETVRPEGRALFRDPYARQFLSPTMKLAVILASLPIGRKSLRGLSGGAPPAPSPRGLHGRGTLTIS